jgi:hypothetical protein
MNALRIHRRAGSLAAGLSLLMLLAGPVLAGGSFHGFSTSDTGKDFQYALLMRNSNTTMSVHGDDVWSDIGRLQEEVKRTGHEVLWFELDDRAYVIRDPATIRRVKDIVEPIQELGKQQGALGARQGELGARQGELGAIQGRIGALQGRVAALQASRDPETRAEAAELRSQLQELAAEQRALGQRQRELGERQRELGARQRVLGERQREASLIAHAELRELAERSIRNGTAERM